MCHHIKIGFAGYQFSANEYQCCDYFGESLNQKYHGRCFSGH